MKYLTFECNGQVQYGAVAGGGIVNLSRRLPEYPSLGALLAAGALNRARSLAETAPGDHGIDDIVFLPPVPRPGKIVCIGVNYANRNKEYGDSAPAPGYPSVFMRTPESVTGHLQLLLRPPESEQLDYEGEIVLVIGERGRRIPEPRARSHIAGLTLMNEGTLRDWVRHGRFNVTQGKNFERSGSVGPWMVSSDEFDRFDDLHLTTRVNGEVRQSDSTANLFFSFERLVNYLSTFMPLNPGDLITTGTPLGAGARFDPPKYLRPGDIVEVEVPGIGVLRNGVEDEVSPP
ncbi:MAG: fumarylacetoacetate hydrolase family protein [Gammaproteobacteria bacterium]|nr:fumarylacetoacetate hydrolase family protein [Gammaproteobacteria bacterium]